MSIIYTLDGKIEKIKPDNIFKYESNFIRKMLDPCDRISSIELEVARLIKLHPHENIVKVFKISKNPMYIDYQLLDTSYHIEKDDMSEYIENIKKGVKHLHKLNVIYVDFKGIFGDNVGYDKETNTYRIYDFNLCGIMDDSGLNWKLGYMPMKYYYNYRLYNKICLSVEKKEEKAGDIKIDDVIIELCKKQELIKIDEILFYVNHGEFIYTSN